ncbi:MAG TPA: response regulator [Candidatus Binatia bacterium]|nr:response regulator [Candidatus Binatia bacterium]
MARKILLADDSVTAQNMGRKILADAGYEVTAVNNGSAALKKIIELKPDLVVLDVYMPGYSGLEVCQRVKESHDTARIPVLLTVGKLEPFKPEEAQRVRAEGYIVKPFEASELLSALSKLEDKVVPRSEPSKPGRFARALASVEESERAREQGNGDGGWKSRINFPHKKSEPEPETDESSTYNALNRDLRTVVEKPADKAQSEAKSERTVDVAAVAPEGLPKDVTPEEIAAIAAAATQIQMAGEAAKASTSAEEPQSSAAGGPQKSVSVEPSASSPQASQEAGTASVQQKAEAPKEEPQDLPATIAVGSDAVATPASRWTAVAVALESEEAGLSLEHEMRKAYAAFSAAEASAPVETVAEFAAHSDPATSVIASSPSASEAVSVQEPLAAVAETMPETESSRSQTPAVEAVPELSRPVAVEPVASVASAEIARTGPVAHEPATLPDTGHAPESWRDFSHARASDLVTPSHAQSPEVPASQNQPPETASSDSALPAPELVPAESATRGESSVHPATSGEQVEPAAESSPHSDSVKSAAAAWASWRQIRDTGKSDAATNESPVPVESNPTYTNEPAAFAAAAGAEQIADQSTAAESAQPESPNAQNGTQDVASIVDSVLADLRPKLMEEISRKMGKK